MQQGGKSQRHSFQVRRRRRRAVIPLLYNGSARIGLLARRGSPVQLGGPFGFCAFALLAPLLLGSLKIALKRTRPRQRFFALAICWAGLYDGGGRLSRGKANRQTDNLSV